MRGQLTGFGSFRLISVLGQGERSLVYLAEREVDAGFHPPVALKVLRPEALADEAEVSAFEARGRAGMRLAHASVAAVLDVGRVDGTPYQVLERVEGLSLEELFPKRGRPRFSPEAATAIVDGVLLALEAAAALSPPLVHGRLDVGCVLVDADGDMRVTGFGAEGEPQADLLDLARLVLQMGVEGAPDLDEWLDGLQDGNDRYADVAAARAALPRLPTGEGKTALARAVKRVQRKRAKEAEAEAEEAAHAATQPPPAPPRIGRDEPAPDPSTTQAPPASSSRAPRRQASAPPEVTSAVRQARGVWITCALFVFAAFLAEILGYSG